MALRHFVQFALAVVLIACVSAPAAAQAARGDFAVSYSALKDADTEETMPVGFAVSAAGYLTPWLGLVGEVGGHGKTVTEFGVDVDVTYASAMGGIRLGSLGGQTRVWVQALVGATRASAKISGSGSSVSDSGNYFSIQPGAGIDIGLTKSIGIRLQGDWRNIQEGRNWFSQYRGAAGIVIAF